MTGLAELRRNLNVVLICISLMPLRMNICSSAICTLSFENSVLLVYLSVGLFAVSFSVFFFISLYILDINPVWYVIIKGFLFFNRLPLNVIVTSAMRSFLILWNLIDQFLYYFVCCWSLFRNSLSVLRPWGVPPIFPSHSFIVSGLTLRSFIHLELSFTQKER